MDTTKIETFCTEHQQNHRCLACWRAARGDGSDVAKIAEAAEKGAKQLAEAKFIGRYSTLVETSMGFVSVVVEHQKS